MNQHEREVRVWDPLVRLFHWSLVIGFFVAWLSGEELARTHLLAGYVVTGLLVFRLVWGFVGTRHARFSDFLYPPAEIIAYLKSLVSGSPRRYLGHNPAGGAMILLLLVSLSGTVATGLVMDAGPTAGEPPSTSALSPAPERRLAWLEEEHEAWEHEEEEDEGEEALEELHEFFANFTLLLVFLHIAGVLVSSRLHGENLVRAMITGRKRA